MTNRIRSGNAAVTTNTVDVGSIITDGYGRYRMLVCYKDDGYPKLQYYQWVSLNNGFCIGDMGIAFDAPKYAVIPFGWRLLNNRESFTITVEA